MHKVFVATILAATVCSAPAIAQGYSPAQQRAACRGDAMRLCWEFVPNRAAITRCMAAKHDQLSSRCVRVFDAGVAGSGR